MATERIQVKQYLLSIEDIEEIIEKAKIDNVTVKEVVVSACGKDEYIEVRSTNFHRTYNLGSTFEMQY